MLGQFNQKHPPPPPHPLPLPATDSLVSGIISLEKIVLTIFNFSVKNLEIIAIQNWSKYMNKQMSQSKI